MNENKIKYEITGGIQNYLGHTLYRVVYVTPFGIAEAGESGGGIQSEKNLEQGPGNAWVSENASVYDNVRVFGNVEVSGNAQVLGNVQVSGNAILRTGITKTSADFVVIGPQGNRNSYATYHIGSDTVCTGCFTGSLQAFEEKVIEKYSNHKYYEQYQKVIQIFKKHQKKGGKQ